ncbi:hypothetical protein GCM10023116_43390 [Kistimonas scapharcae]|uniref:Replication protein P n=1 Tax=Kistimonas scapharcae TaxID=1036133 RepID=A0ABP8VAJ8_9GAMM
MVFGAMKIAWPGQYDKHFGREGKEKEREAAKRMWMQDEAFSRLTEQQIAIGIKKMISGSEYMPSLASFVNFCKAKPEDLGIPSVAEAWREACNNSHEVLSHKWSHQAVYLAGKQTDWHQIRGASGEKEVSRLRNQFGYCYQALVNRLMAGEDISGEIPLAITDQSRKTVEQMQERRGREQVAKAMEEYGIPERLSASSAMDRMRASLSAPCQRKKTRREAQVLAITDYSKERLANVVAMRRRDLGVGGAA